MAGWNWTRRRMAGAEVLDLVRFVEKPDADTAQNMLDQGRFLWNAGIFLFSVATHP